MSANQDTIKSEVYGFLKSRGYDPKLLSTSGKSVPVESEAEVIGFTFTKDGVDYGNAYCSLDNSDVFTIYETDKIADSPSEDSSDDLSWSDLIVALRQMTFGKVGKFDVDRIDNLEHDMAKREHTKKLDENYYAINKKSSYSDNIPTVKIHLQHSRALEEGEQRYRNIERIFIENTLGERFLAPTNKPGIARVYARHIAEGGKVNDNRWNHISGLCEEYNKMAGFVRATRSKQFNESTQKLVNEGINHYQKLRETLRKLTGKKGYGTYFESYTPPLMEDEEQVDLSEMFMSSSLDPRIECVMPILSKLSKNITENNMKEVGALEEWADSITETPLNELVEGDEQTNEYVSGGNFKPPKIPKNKNNGPWGDDDDDDDDGFDWSKEPNKIGKKMLELQHKRIKIIWRPWLDKGHDIIANIKNIRPMDRNPNVIEFTYSWKTSGGKWQKRPSSIGPNAVEDFTLVPVGANVYELKELPSEGISESSDEKDDGLIAGRYTPEQWAKMVAIVKKKAHAQNAKKMAKVSTNKPIGTRVSDIGPGGKEHNVKTDAEWDKQKGVAEGSEQTVNLDNLDKLINRTDYNLARKGDPARYHDVEVDKRTKIIYWVTQETTTKQSQEFAIRLVNILKNNGFNGWTVKVVRRDLYNGKRSPWKVAIVEQGVAEGNLNEFVPPNNDGSDNERSRRLRKLLEIAIQVAKQKNVDELGMIHAMNTIAGDEFFNTAVDGLLPDITDREYRYVLESAYKTVKQGLAEGSDNKYSKLSNRGANRGINRAADDFDRMMDLDQAESPYYKTQHQQDTKQRLKTKPLAGPKGVLPEQGVAEGTYNDDVKRAFPSGKSPGVKTGVSAPKGTSTMPKDKQKAKGQPIKEGLNKNSEIIRIRKLSGLE